MKLFSEHKIGVDGNFVGEDDVLLEKINVYFNEIQVKILASGFSK